MEKPRRISIASSWLRTGLCERLVTCAARSDFLVWIQGLAPSFPLGKNLDFVEVDALIAEMNMEARKLQGELA